ncbi:hypothetical protein EJ03DRAFT_372273 [Teratosphaeria nubilosa]|uniref:Uncharacterized protein n=1 Tax=Teratosphaeria nubilosa TaxID=161662 RepID=A0A6G1LGW3_9PEZI|nr:hypothetical protein EJ03DRAFT_372273 [Teratosphaeria nubilosa]
MFTNSSSSSSTGEKIEKFDQIYKIVTGYNAPACHPDASHPKSVSVTTLSAKKAKEFEVVEAAVRDFNQKVMGANQSNGKATSSVVGHSDNTIDNDQEPTDRNAVIVEKWPVDEISLPTYRKASGKQTTMTDGNTATTSQYELSIKPETAQHDSAPTNPKSSVPVLKQPLYSTLKNVLATSTYLQVMSTAIS